ncbi:hypothetical protein TRIUR3_03490 [Triticum urartu]|uniref:Uncharacterized protein n=1 Tax=Triticum urartu TaxID=4572 RepID=M7ZX90_TRIUA|nr:hypothetical protein TRIUR3_03490 [Triticum urartu]
MAMVEEAAHQLDPLEVLQVGWMEDSIEAVAPWVENKMGTTVVMAYHYLGLVKAQLHQAMTGIKQFFGGAIPQHPSSTRNLAVTSKPPVVSVTFSARKVFDELPRQSSAAAGSQQLDLQQVPDRW